MTPQTETLPWQIPPLIRLAGGSGSSHRVIPTEMALVPQLFCACQKDRSEALHNRFKAVSIFTMEKGIAAEKMPFGGQGLSRGLECENEIIR